MSFAIWVIVPGSVGVWYLGTPLTPHFVGILFGVFTGSSAHESELECRVQTPTSLLCELCLTWTVKLPYFWPPAVLIGLNKGIKVEDPAKSLTQGVIIPAMLPLMHLYPPHPLLGHPVSSPICPCSFQANITLVSTLFKVLVSTLVPAANKGSHKASCQWYVCGLLPPAPAPAGSAAGRETPAAGNACPWVAAKPHRGLG